VASYNLNLFELSDAAITPDPNMLGYTVTGEHWSWDGAATQL